MGFIFEGWAGLRLKAVVCGLEAHRSGQSRNDDCASAAQPLTGQDMAVYLLAADRLIRYARVSGVCRACVCQAQAVGESGRHVSIFAT